MQPTFLKKKTKQNNLIQLYFTLLRYKSLYLNDSCSVLHRLMMLC